MALAGVDSGKQHDTDIFSVHYFILEKKALEQVEQDFSLEAYIQKST